MDSVGTIIRDFQDFILDKAYPCVAARAAIAREHLACFIADHMECPKDDHLILAFLYKFIENFRGTASTLHSAAVIFKRPDIQDEESFDTLLWKKLESLRLLDEKRFSYDKRVSADPLSPDFSFSLGEEAFFIIGLHPASSRIARKFKYPVLVFNPHAQFEHLRNSGLYGKMKDIVRQRDRKYSGSINPMLSDFGNSSEIYQYSGRQYDDSWKCPLQQPHGATEHHPAEK